MAKSRGGFYLTYPLRLTPQEHEQLSQLREIYNIPASAVIRNMIELILKDPNGYAAHEIIIRTEKEGLKERYFLFRIIAMALQKIDKANLTEAETKHLNELLTEIAINIGQTTKDTVFDLKFDLEQVKKEK